ncbi:hypothetical protein HDU84_005074 [Entophlyctis sp. JEL0112]|nr:hypothetical protein HDU84_005074 [Entophlyctis sp. JEL0112]
MTVSAIAWVPKAAAREAPQRCVLDDARFADIQAAIASRIHQARADLADAGSPSPADAPKEPANPSNAAKKANVDDDFVKVFDLDNYDNDASPDFMGNAGMDDEESDDQSENEDEDENADGPLFPAVKSLAVEHNDGFRDPNVTVDDSVDDAEELEEMMIAATDNLILAARTEDDISHVEVYLYEGEEDNLFVHHDIMLPSFPLCLEWLNYDIAGKGQSKGSYVAVGTFDPEIEIWDLDTIDAPYPSLILGAPTTPIEQRGTSTRKKRASKKPHPDYHVDAVMCLAWNAQHPSLLASGSADTTIKLWDLSASPATAVRSFSHAHRAKVAALAWNPVQTSVLLSGGYDRVVAVFDTRAPDPAAAVNRFTLSADVEAARWDPLHPERFVVASEDGVVKCFDGRAVGKPIFTIHAHDGAASALDVSAHVDGLIVTGGDRATKIWETKDPTKIRCLASKDLQVGKVYAASFSPDDDLIVSIGGGAGKVVVWNLEGNANVRRAVRGADSSGGSSSKKEVTALEADDDEGDTDNDDMDAD